MKHTCVFTIAVNVLLFFPQINLAQAPNLGTTASFALFTAAGAFANTGASSITGDIGTNTSPLTGFPPGTVVGEIHVTDGVTAQAATDVAVAYNDLLSIPCGEVIGAGLGNGQTLVPGVYCPGNATSLTGNLVLDGQGNANALFIFKIDGAFSVDAFSSVTLINSASIANVYWQVNGAFSLGAGALFTGTVIANGDIILSSNASIQGRALSTAGIISLDNNIVTRPALVSLPIELVSFASDCNNQQVVLKWSTASETNNDYYSIERSADGANWVIAGKVAAAGNSTSLKNYTYTDIPPYTADVYYRLKQTDINGKHKYFKIIIAKNCKAALTVLDIYPNPASQTINLLFNGNKDQVQTIDIYNAAGYKVFSTNRYQSVINISNIPSGIHSLHLKMASGSIIKKFIIRKGL